ncbi:MAG: hypothetical protein KGP35_07560 [Bacteroidetes bacterium]|nr:hypothetical protein [Bacteroidota bacterium]
MKETTELRALIQLLDDPDPEVYQSVCNRIISIGNDAIPNLEKVWESADNSFMQERIETLIHTMQTGAIENALEEWTKREQEDLIKGLYLISKYHFPDLKQEKFMQQVDKIRRNVWLELNPYLTALEQTNVLTGILFQYYQFKSEELDYRRGTNFIPSSLIETKTGNAVSLGILQYAIAQLSEIPLRIIQIPEQIILGYFKRSTLENSHFLPNEILFYVDGANGQLYSYAEVEKYLKKMNISDTTNCFQPLTNQKIMLLLLQEYAKCYNNRTAHYKYEEILRLAAILRGEMES